MNRREFLVAGGTWLAASSVGSASRGGTPAAEPSPPQLPAAPADITLRIGEMALELAPRRTVKTLAYNGQVPGPLLRVRRGRPLAVDIWNDTKQEDILHWHGLHIPGNVDGSLEEGTPGVPPNRRVRYAFTPEPGGTRWYHSHAPGGRDLSRGGYSGQFGMMIVESGDDAGAYDQEVAILLHEWEPRITQQGPADVEYRYFSINGKMLGAGEPVRVRPSQRVLFRIVNASATAQHRLALPGHSFEVVALDGNPVPNPGRVPLVDLGPGERVDAIVTMNRPGVWILGEVDNGQRAAGMGIVVEYAGAQGPARWEAVPEVAWDYTRFGGTRTAPAPDDRISIVLRSEDGGHSHTINGKAHPRTDPILVRANTRYRWLLDNQSAYAHPMHLHRHTFELVRVAETVVSGVLKDVVVVPAWSQVEFDMTATQPGISLFHCHNVFHMEMGMMAMVHYVD